jgi:hypothetical protein
MPINYNIIILGVQLPWWLLWLMGYICLFIYENKIKKHPTHRMKLLIVTT